MRVITIIILRVLTILQGVVGHQPATEEDGGTQYAAPINSPWDGNMYRELAQWGYTESERSQMCDFDAFWGLDKAFEGIRMDPRSTQRQGPNKCFHVGHGDPHKTRPDGSHWQLSEQTYVAPGGRVNRVTGAFSTIGVNPISGMVFFISRKSAFEAAKALWGQNSPHEDELPALRATSDFAWAFWNREVRFSTITAIWSICVTNQITLSILEVAMKTYLPPPGQQRANGFQVWPGTDFEMHTIEAQAILGTPNGIGAGFFLAQHKHQLGGNKMIYKITVFKAFQPVTEDDSINLIFWVKDSGFINGRADVGVVGKNIFEKSKVVKRSADGRNFVREHTIIGV
ncbi:conserved hypothetical protein [Pyrenophora tritici-repentis Pt-1C-BFP]|uniref:Uncharacterized protein n=1 Tax=Pyrenophora tritici-repentis (strain Pt-1C-BFP) TaxID=426418 RepID=B2WHQ4_PYRTR|nr:uncharacterized protein PTRG_09513 [Pyrenophora tritici-repentis Pt-1C-BFP]EDU42564.1 conserved hypothetical protein [Pyrenophora tritici-repentis Pt-1C-BFP]